MDMGAEFAGQLFFRLWRASHTNTAAALETIGLTPALFAVLNHLRDNDGAIQQEIGAAMGIDPSTMVSLIDKLEKAGLAGRKPREQDRRAREVSLTPAGRKALDRGRELAAQVEEEVLSGLSKADRRSGGGGIRTLGRGVTPTTVFETARFNHSRTPPRRNNGRRAG